MFDELVDLIFLVIQVVEGLDRVLVVLLLEGHQVVGDAKSLRGPAILGRHRRYAVVDLAVLVQCRCERREADDHSGLARLEQIESLGAIGLARVVLRNLVLDGELLQEGERLDVLVRVDRPLVAVFPVATVVEGPDRELTLSLFRSERLGVADIATA